MTREPDRYEAKARELDRWIVRHYCVPEHYTSWPEIAAALRDAESSALERAAQLFEEDAKQSDAHADGAWRDGESDSVVDHHRREARICRSDAARIRALASPAAAPAAEKGKAEDRCCYTTETGAYRCTLPAGHSEWHRVERNSSPAAPPSEPPAEKRIAELETALRELSRRASDPDLYRRIGASWLMLEGAVKEADAILAARAAKGKGEGT